MIFLVQKGLNTAKNSYLVFTKKLDQNKNYDQTFTLCQLFYENFIKASTTANQTITLCQLFYENFIKASETATKSVL